MKNGKKITKKGNSKLQAGMIGAVAGTVIGGTAAVMFSDKKNREKVAGALGRLKDKAVQGMEEIQDQSYSMKKVIIGKKNQGKKDAKKLLAETKKLSNHAKSAALHA